MNYAEQIAAFEAKGLALVKANEAIMAKAADEGATLDQEQSDQFDENEADLAEINKHLDRLRTAEKAAVAKAVPVAGSDAEKASTSRSGISIKAAPKLEPGLGFARVAKVKALAQLDGESVREVARSLYGENSGVYGHFVKAAVPAANTDDPAWAGDLITDGAPFADFLEFLRAQTIVGQFGLGGIPNLRRIPFDVPLGAHDVAAQAAWVGEGQAKPLTQAGIVKTILRPYKVAGIAVSTEEMLRRAAISAEIWIRDELANAVRERIDTDFIDPDKAEVVGTSPGSITNGVTPVIATADLRADLVSLMNEFYAANRPLNTGVWIMNTRTANSIATLQNPLGQSQYPGLTARGGTLFGMPVIVSNYVPSDYEADPTGAPGVTGSIIVLAEAGEIYFADEGGVRVDMSREASLEMNDAPTHDSTTPTGASLVSMWQTNSVAFRAERILNWGAARTGSVAVLGNVQ